MCISTCIAVGNASEVLRMSTFIFNICISKKKISVVQFGGNWEHEWHHSVETKQGGEKADFYPYAGILSGLNWISEAEQSTFFPFFFLMARFHSSHTSVRAKTEQLQ